MNSEEDVNGGCSGLAFYWLILLLALKGLKGLGEMTWGGVGLLM